MGGRTNREVIYDLKSLVHQIRVILAQFQITQPQIQRIRLRLQLMLLLMLLLMLFLLYYELLLLLLWLWLWLLFVCGYLLMNSCEY